MDEIKRWGSVHSILSKAVREGWNSLKFQISIREKSLTQGSFPFTNVKLSNLSPSVREDLKSRLLFPNDVSHKNLTPVEVIEDGNCFFRSISNSLYGSQGRHVECRVHCLVELVMNTGKYLRQDTYTHMSSNRTDLQYVIETSVSDEARVSGDMTKSLQNEIPYEGKDGSMAKHENSDSHKAASIEYQTLKTSLANPKCFLPYKISQQNREMYDRNMQLLSMITESIVLCGKQNIPLRGHRDDSTSTSSNKGNFLAILNLLASHGDKLAQHLKGSSTNATYISKITQNEIINIIGQNIRLELLRGLQQGKAFHANIADEVTDKYANQEVLTLCLRFLDETASEPIIREEFFDFVHLERPTGVAISDKIVEILQENGLSVENIRGQAYDGAASMASEKTRLPRKYQRTE